MSKFVVVTKVPAQLGKGESVITQPDFLEQITAKRAGALSNRTALHLMRDILLAIQEKYQVDLGVYKIALSKYEGLPFNPPEEFSRIITDIITKERPSAFEGMLEYNIKNRPYGTKLVYYVGRHNDTGPFFKQGIDMIEEKDVEEYLGHKPKKVVGKPAVTKEEAAG